MGRSLAAILVPIVIVGILSALSDGVIRSMMPNRFAADGRTTDTLVLILILLVSAAFSLFGGYLVARIAARAETRHALICAAIVLTLSVVLHVAMDPRTPAWYTTLSFVVPVVAILAGAQLHARA